MFIFTILGYTLSSLLIAILIAYKVTKDIYPHSLKLWLLKLSISNWARKHAPLFGLNYNTLNPSCTAETGIVPSSEESEIELRPLNNDTPESLSFYGVDPLGNFLWTQFIRSDSGSFGKLSLVLFMDGVEYTLEKVGPLYNKNEYDFGNFRMECVEPLRCWRVWYNGAMVNTQKQKEGINENLVHVVINSLWKPFDSQIDFKADPNVHLLAKYFSESGRFGENLSSLQNLVGSGYAQYGSFHGTLVIDEVERNDPFYLYGFRTKKSLINHDNNDGNVEFFGYCETVGNSFRLYSNNPQSSSWTDGQIMYSSDLTNQIQSTDFQIKDRDSLPKAFRIVDTDSKSFTFEILENNNNKTEKVGNSRLVPLRLMINGKPGRGIYIRNIQENEDKEKSISPKALIQDISFPNEIPHILPFTSKLCLNPNWVGGKGASLAKLAQTNNLTDESFEDGESLVKFNTAKGFCLTTSFFMELLNLEEINEIFSSQSTSFTLADACSSVIKLIKSSSASNRMSPIIQEWIQKTFDQTNVNHKLMRFAVRSSGTLEDGSELSCAGQNETFLGIKVDNISEKVVECWSSLFTLQSVQYRLNHGQPLVTEMAVVIQEMVNAKSAGVCFTANPRTGNPFEILINGNWGLGESVVSASCDPDTILLQSSRNYNTPSLLTIHSKALGTKQSKIMIDENSTTEILVETQESSAYCISDEHSLKLGKIVKHLELKIGNGKSVDVEWAINENGQIFILQVRSITSLDSWTDFELIHELDTPLHSINHERLTNANTGEVMPGATSPLSLSIVTRIIDVGIQRRFKMRTHQSIPIVPYVLRSTNISRLQVLLNVINTFGRNNDKEITPVQIAMDLSVFGHPVMDKELHSLGVERFGYTPGLQKLKEFYSILMTVFYRQKKQVKEAADRYQNYSIPLEQFYGKSSQEIYDEITVKVFDLYDILFYHCGMSEASGATQMFAFLTLAGGAKNVEDWTSEIFEDASKVFSVCMDVESADMPSAMDELANIIIQYAGTPEELQTSFLNPKLSPSSAFQWLRSHKDSKVQEALDTFFTKHGHRCIGELDLMRQSWKSDPIPFVQLVQNLVKNKLKFKDLRTHQNQNTKNNDIDKLIGSLNTKLSSFAKRFLKFIIPYCRNAVWNREKTKSLSVRTGDELKGMIRLLGETMVKENLIPDPNLLFFMTHYQVGKVLQKDVSSSRILNKAMRKMKLHPVLSKEVYPEITIGLREPRKYASSNANSTNLVFGDSLQGTPVSSGMIEAPVKVCLNIEEAARVLERGDILITTATDIGWSPFFPILGGIVTELGGLISHGAVVAREYGLPCIVGAIGATQQFQTGDRAILDAGKGTLTKVKVQVTDSN